MAFTDSQISEMKGSHSDCVSKLSWLLLSYVNSSYRSDKGREYGVHGFGRRLKSIQWCLGDVFDTIPLEEENPSPSALNRANSLIHSFTINVFGALDNLAHIWVNENDVRDENGRLLSGRKVGFSKEHREFWKSLPIGLKSCVSSSAEWYLYLSNFRHALAHRIPPYLVPRIFSNDDANKWKELDTAKLHALREYDFDRHEEISDEQDRIGKYDPLMTHSFEEGARPVLYHPQLICDALTIHEIGQKFLECLPAPDGET
jgi:hypothetical protein